MINMYHRKPKDFQEEIEEESNEGNEIEEEEYRLINK
jgi:hypothetical protein